MVRRFLALIALGVVLSGMAEMEFMGRGAWSVPAVRSLLRTRNLAQSGACRAPLLKQA